MQVSHTTGNISFYEDTGTSIKLFWDANTQELATTALDNTTTTYPIKISNSAGTLTTGYGAYGMSMPAGSAYTMAINGDLVIAADGNVEISTGDVLPGTNTQDLGSVASPWQNIYTQDLVLSNESRAEGNSVDGTKGNWTIQEGEEHLYIINNKNGKKYKFALEEIM